MDHRAALILAASLLCGSAHATYATLSAPAGWTPGAGAAATYSSPVSPAQIAVSELARINANAALTVNGTKVTVPAKLPIVKSAAKKVAAAAIYLHPGLRTAATVASWIGAAGFAYDVANGWQRPESGTVSDGYSYYAVDRTSAGAAATPEAAAQFWVTYQNQMNGKTTRSELSGSCEPFKTSNQTRCPFTDTDIKTGYSYVRYAAVKRSPVCPAGWFHTPAGCVQSVPMVKVPKEDFIKQLEADPRIEPDDLPNVVWPASWPVELPQVQPMFVPTGNPVPNPNYDPAKAPSPTNQPFNQPGVKVVPAPTTDRPWQVDLQPVNRPVDKADPSPEPKVDPPPEPGTDGNGDKPREPDKETQDLCEKHPEIIACQKLDEPEDPGELKTKAADLDFQVQSGYAGSAVCPAPMTYEAFGHVLSLSWQPFCDSLSMVKNLLLAFAWISAAFILLGAKKE
ncbi:IgG-binding virulence factor TspB family protein [Comamonas testosteroni]|uniref:IgG-binding virulence factor TspB family protein n=1 Tax=Comamonas testosteroni TaxID=285 RepID=UPI0015FD7AA8|nr:IgG-binding virulence factor TspB family protein [Comamonas testosteroni]